MTETLPQPEGLIRVLLDAGAPFSDRDDAALDLAGFDGAEVERALTQVASDPKADPDLIETSAESLAEIWGRLKRVDWSALARLTPAGRKMAVAVLLAANPDLKDAITARLGGTPPPPGAFPRAPKEEN